MTIIKGLENEIQDKNYIKLKKSDNSWRPFIFVFSSLRELKHIRKCLSSIKGLSNLRQHISPQRLLKPIQINERTLYKELFK